MHSSPRVVFSRFRDGDDPLLLAWSRFRSSLDVLPVDEAPASRDRRRTPDVDRTVWRVLASNNREVVRSARVYPSYDEAQRDALLAQQRVADLELHIVRGPVAGAYGWVVSLDDRAVATSSRWYPSSMCAESATGALALLARVDVAGGTWTYGRSRRGSQSETAPRQPSAMR
ncbi:hypothetical protein MN032_01440 [Agromyces atrinae]|uniref:hypothetical protein n=1 Tax=Agromyces atrinae TaxID=592376 RepID=UPI001F5AF787|nr:hypothetical protein [Agromyces atrinae]MCI2956340.1 hypothetical protein [Agromyces atrinae]